jgi:hypothetical protein
MGEIVSEVMCLVETRHLGDVASIFGLFITVVGFTLLCGAYLDRKLPQNRRERPRIT